jgi:acyl-CoA dehydrogenase
MVETDEVEGFARGRNLEKIGLKSQDTSELFFDNVRVPTTNLLGVEEGPGFFQLMGQLPQERLIIGVGAVTVMEEAVRVTRDYVKERQAFGKPLTALQNTRFVLAECMTETTVARTFIDQGIMQLQEGKLDATTGAMAKYWTTDLECKIVDKCLQMFSGFGYMMEYPIAKMYVNSGVQRIYGGANEIMKELIGRTI